jgi:hypothetical protein
MVLTGGNRGNGVISQSVFYLLSPVQAFVFGIFLGVLSPLSGVFGQSDLLANISGD